MSEDLVSVAILEDDKVLLEALSQFVAESPGLLLAWTGSTIREGQENLGFPPRVLLCDLELEDGLAFDLIAEFCRETSTLVIVVSIFGDEESTLRAIEAGASGYLLKDTPLAGINEGIHSILRGESPLSAGVAGHLLKRIRKPQLSNALKLTDRETEVLEKLARGQRTKEVAEALGCSYHTVAQHVRNIYEKLAVRSRSEAIFQASKAGIISLDE